MIHLQCLLTSYDFEDILILSDYLYTLSSECTFACPQTLTLTATFDLYFYQHSPYTMFQRWYGFGQNMSEYSNFV